MKFISRATLGGFRCFDADSALALNEVNVFAGPNNAGKSALFQALRRLASINTNRHQVIKPRIPGGFVGRDPYVRFEPADRSNDEAPPRIELELTQDFERFFRSYSPWSQEKRQQPRSGASHAEWYESSRWPITVCMESKAGLPPISIIGEDRAAVNYPAGLVHLVERLPLVFVPEDRRLRAISLAPAAASDDEPIEERVDGRRIGWELLTWQVENPAAFEEVEQKLSAILADAVKLVVMPSRGTIQASIGGFVQRDLGDLGAGVTSALIICHALVKYQGGILLLEEPELHLHPRVQRNLLRLLVSEANSKPWQIFLTTHSNHVLDGLAGQSAVSRFSVRQNGGSSAIEAVDEGKLRELVELLGARAGSLAEANAVIWVEGPSDAIYLRFFFGLLADPPREHLDFSFAFFGGSLLAHQSLSEELADGLVSLLKIHPHAYLVADRDADSPEAQPTKLYLQRVLGEAGHRVWITHGREIEDYLRPEVGAVVGPYERGKSRKVDYARSAVAEMQLRSDVAWLESLDLTARLEMLREFLRVSAEPCRT